MDKIDPPSIDLDDLEPIGADEYPLKTSHLRKGDRVTLDEIEHAFSTRRDTEDFRFKMLRAQRYIERRFLERGEPVTTRTDDKIGILILTDEEALVYNTKRFEQETRQRNRAFVRLSQTDRGQLGEKSKTLLDRKVIELGHRVQADRRAKRDASSLLSPAKRTTPELPAKTKK